MDPQQSTASQQENAMIQKSVALYHTFIITTHLKIIRAFLGPLLDGNMYDNVVKLMDCFEMDCPVPNLKAVDLMMMGALKQMGPFSKDKTIEDGGEFDVIRMIEAGQGFDLNCVDGDIPLVTVCSLTNEKIARVSSKDAKEYLEYCKKAVLINFARICKLSVEYEFPVLGERLSSSLKSHEYTLQLPYVTACRNRSTSSQQLMDRIASLLYRMSSNMLPEDGAEQLMQLDRRQIGDVESFLLKLAPSLQQVCHMVNENLDAANPESIDTHLTGTLTKLVQDSLGNGTLPQSNSQVTTQTNEGNPRVRYHSNSGQPPTKKMKT